MLFSNLLHEFPLSNCGCRGADDSTFASVMTDKDRPDIKNTLTMSRTNSGEKVMVKGRIVSICWKMVAKGNHRKKLQKKKKTEININNRKLKY